MQASQAGRLLAPVCLLGLVLVPGLDTLVQEPPLTLQVLGLQASQNTC
jgi:hypothetical protein